MHFDNSSNHYTEKFKEVPLAQGDKSGNKDNGESGLVVPGVENREVGALRLQAET